MPRTHLPLPERYSMKLKQPVSFLLIILICIFSFRTATASSFVVAVSGQGSPMILIPGMACSGEVWRSTVDHYNDRYECHVLTLAGFAGVPPVQSDWFVDQVKNELIFYIRENRLVKPVIIGHALGGFIALWLATAEPDLVSKIVVVDALPFLPAAFYPNATPATSAPFANQLRQRLLTQTDEQFRQSQITSFRNLITDTAVADAASVWGQTSDKETVAEVTYELQTIDLRQELEKIRCPVFVIATYIQYAPVQTHDGIAALFNQQYALVKNYQLSVSDKARHFVMLDDPQGFHEETNRFLSSY